MLLTAYVESFSKPIQVIEQGAMATHMTGCPCNVKATRVAALAGTDIPQVLVSCADWVEHALETDADPYLRTPEEDLSFIERHNLDVYLAVAHFVLPVVVKLSRKLKDIMDLMLYYYVLGLIRGGGALLNLLQRIDLRIHPHDLAHFRWLLSFL